MRNIEKYKDEIFNRINECELAKAIYLVKEGKMADCDRKCKLCRDACVRWLLEEYKGSILDDKEREYLSAVIMPFKNRVVSIAKYDTQFFQDRNFICIVVLGEVVTECINLPYFKINTMYKGMETGKEYTLEELGL